MSTHPHDPIAAARAALELLRHPPESLTPGQHNAALNDIATALETVYPIPLTGGRRADLTLEAINHLAGKDPSPGIDGTPAWAYDEDGYCVACGNGRWKNHGTACELRDALDRSRFLDPTRDQMKTTLVGAIHHEYSIDQLTDAVMALLAPCSCGSVLTDGRHDDPACPHHGHTGAAAGATTPQPWSEFASDLRSAARTVRGASWPLEMGEWADGLADRLERYAAGATTVAPPAPTAPEPWRASSSSTATIVAGGRHPITDEMYPLALFHQGQPADLYMATLVARALNTVGIGVAAGSSPAGTPQEAQLPEEQKLVDLLGNLEQSLSEAKAERDRVVAERSGTPQEDEQ